MRGNAQQTKVHYKGKQDDFVIFVESKEAVQSWKSDKSVPLAQVVDGYKIFITHKQGNTGILDTASKGTLEDEFGTHKDDDVMNAILEKGQIVESENSGRDGGKNDAQGGRVAH
ncbi:uncharacterized protein LTR77_004461 [Saxophila tyrrhenica]|uniref:Ribosome maturation protein SDO1/SBDS N-terminal domain-containing protein n=1 Tax=Saxophila tyrrhenica TaxID=1690608 RepID=A0AAV9PCU8_9PEZI|nr:hypothetical protein LTR77_004461 [Saxophila tyrrhenica]